MNKFESEFLRGVRISGADAPEFADAQLSLDVDGAAARQWHPAAWCDPKGRVIAILLVERHATEVRLVLPAAQADDVVDRLERYTIGRDVQLGRPGPVSAAWLEGASDNGDFSPLAPQPERGIALGRHGRACADSECHWRLADLALGLAWLSAPVSGNFLPQMLGLEALGGISFRKGCFPGQEVIARVHYRGRVTRRLTGLRLEGEQPVPQPGDSVALGNHTATVVDALALPGACAALVVVPAGLEDGTRVDIEGRAGQILAPPELC